ncbi:MAG: SCO family protein [Xanthomonadales bacterium]
MKSNRQRLITVLLAVVVAAVSAVGGYALFRVLDLRQNAELQALLVLPEPRAVPAFALTDQYGEPFGPQRLDGRWSLLFFGFTHCPDICPGTLFELARVTEGLKQAGDGVADRVQVVFVSVDPERDRPERLRDYIDYFDPAFIAVTGTHEALEPLTRKLGIAYRIEPHAEGAAQYSVDHSASVLLLDPAGRLHGVFPAPHDAAAIEADLLNLIERE